MQVTYKTTELQRYAEDSKYSLRNLGTIKSNNYTKRIVALMSAQSLEDVRNLPGNYHELTGDRKGQWACSLDGNNRMVFTPHEDPIPTNPDGQYIWSEIKGVEIIEIVDYHK
ncbi:MAG: killer suppression protein HigA [Bacteroidales bacterium]|nr:killer suppression protein HigA [Bacteroidales bacterium]MBR5907025.1 killer suppression protein HigA [Bacteroidales bacterium]